MHSPASSAKLSASKKTSGSPRAHLIALSRHLQQNPLWAHGDQGVAVREPLAPADMGAVEAVAPPQRRPIAPDQPRFWRWHIARTAELPNGQLVLVHCAPLTVRCCPVVEDEHIALSRNAMEETASVLAKQPLVTGVPCSANTRVSKAVENVPAGCCRLFSR